MAKLTAIQARYAQYLSAWQVKLCGPLPTDAELTTAEKYARAGGKVTLGLAMALRADGATNTEIIDAVGRPQNNVRNGLVRTGVWQRKAVAQRAGLEVYACYVTAAKPAKAKAKAKATAAKPARKAATAAADAPAADATT